MFGHLFGGKPYKPNWRQEHGTAVWTTDYSVQRAMYKGDGTFFDSIPLGVNTQQGSVGPIWNMTAMQGHGFCFAPNRSGKGTSVIIPALLTYGGSMLVVDPKGENAWITAPYRRRMGQRVIILDGWNEVNKFGHVTGVERSSAYNPLAFLDASNRDFQDEVTLIANALLLNNSNADHNFWTGNARAYFEGLIGLAIAIHGHKATLATVYDLVAGPLHTVAELLLYAPPSPAQAFAKRELAGFFQGGTVSDQVISFQREAQQQTRFLASPAIRDVVANDRQPFTMEMCVSRPTTVYLVLPPERLVSHAGWLRMMLSLYLSAVTRAPARRGLPTLMLIDEMGNLGRLPQLENAIGIAAGYDLRVFGFLQDLTQMQRDYPHTWENFLNNSSVLQVLAAKGHAAEYFCGLLGNQTITENRFGNAQFQQTQRARPLMFPHEMEANLGSHPGRLADNTQLVRFMQGAANIRTLQNPYFNQPGWRGVYRPPPGH